MIQSLWRDEGFSYLLAKFPLPKILYITGHDFNPPLYYILLHFYMKLFGTTEVAMRSLSLIFFAINIYVITLFLENIFKILGRRLYFYIFLLAINPFLLYYAFEARMYSLFALLTSLSFYFFIRQDWKKYILFTILGLFTHYFFIFVVMTQIVYAYFFDNAGNPKKIKAAFFSYLIFLPWALYASPTLLTKTGSFWTTRLNTTDILISFATLYTGLEKSFTGADYIMIFASIGLFFITLFLYINMKKKDHHFKLLLLWSFLFYFIIMGVALIKPIFVPRYLIFASVGFNLLLIYMLEHTKKRLRYFFLFLLIAFCLIFNLAQTKIREKADYRSTIGAIKKLATRDDYLYITDPLLYFVATYYFDSDRVFLYRDKSYLLPQYIGTIIIDEKKITTKLPVYPKKAFILRNDSYEIVSTF